MRVMTSSRIGEPVACRREMRLVSIGSSRNVASRMTPVSPMPATVAQNNSGSRSGPSSTTVVSASIIRIRVT
jgi:hypothetical protein